jgi:hypothetical protein
MQMAMPTTGKNNRGRQLVPWTDEVWNSLDNILMAEMMRTRVAAKFLPHVYVDRMQTNVHSDVVIQGTPDDAALSIDEARTTRINEFFVQWKLTPPQVEQEVSEGMAVSQNMMSGQNMIPGQNIMAGHSQEPMMMGQHPGQMGPYRPSTAASLAIRSGILLAKAEDSILINGRNALANDPLFLNQLVQARDQNINTNLDLGLLNIDPNGKNSAGNPAVTVTLPGIQVVQVFPVLPGTEGSPPRYAENTLNAVARGFSQLQAAGLYGHYAAVFHTVPYADLHEALATTLIEPVEPIGHLVKAGVYGTSAMPPFKIPAQGQPTGGLPTAIADGTPLLGKVLYTGLLICLDGNTADLVRGRMDNNLDNQFCPTQTDDSGDTRFRTSQRFCLRLKDTTAVIVFLFLDQPPTKQPPTPRQ